jgi:hypothetical protein
LAKSDLCTLADAANWISLAVGGTTFSASQQLVVSAAPQVLTSIQLQTTVQ